MIARQAATAAAASAALALCAAGCGACEPSIAPPDADGPHSADVTTATSSALMPSDRPRWSPLPRSGALPCRAATVVGKVTALVLGDGGATIAPSGEVPDEAWIDVEPAARITTRDPRSSREMTFEGPARVRACVNAQPGQNDDEEAWLLRGVFASVAGAGERPGGEAWVVTPLGVVRYAAAAVRITAKGNAVEARVSSGTVYVWTADGTSIALVRHDGRPAAQPGQHLDAGPSAALDVARNVQAEDGWSRVDGGGSANLNGPTLAGVPPEASARGALERCTALAKSAHDLASAIAAPDAALADLAPRHVIARRVARAACQVARLRIEALPPAPSRDGFLEKVRSAEGDWRFLGQDP